MHPKRIADALSMQPRYARSVHVERDLSDSSALHGYVVTPQVKDCFRRLASGLAAGSTQRAWRITGDYGSGKSSFALALARTLSGSGVGVPKELKQQAAILGRARDTPTLLPVVVVGSRAPLTQGILIALARSLRAVFQRGRPPQLLARLDQIVSSQLPAGDAAVLQFIREAAALVQSSERASGLLVVLDEMGKFLEFTAQRPDQQDIYFLQQLAELAARSGDTPILVVGILHQGFSAYAANVSDLARREWEKVAGRYSELLFNQPLDQLAQLAAHALGVHPDRLPVTLQRRAKSAMQDALELGWYGPLANKSELLALAPRLYPLHPTVLPVAARLFTRFGQNERSFLGFLLSDELRSVRSFSQRPVGEFYTLSDLYDYARASMGTSLAISSYRSHWNLIDSLISSFPTNDPQSLRILKAVGIVNLIDDQSVLATDRSIDVSVGGWSEPERDSTLKSIASLQKGKRVLYHRGALGGLCLWPYTSVNIEHAYQDARRASSLPAKLSPLLNAYVDVSPLVARRHYIETGNFRVFSVSHVSVSELESKLQTPATTDGEILVVTPEAADDRQIALTIAADSARAMRPGLLIAVTQPLSTMGRLLTEVRCWEWVVSNTSELNGDAYALEEVTRQLSASRRIITERVRDLVGIGPSASATQVQWYRAGQQQRVANGKELVALLSEVCDELYPKAPIVLNELINRNTLSSAAAAARMRLIERMLTCAGEPVLGMDPTKSPPERSMYRSVLERGRLHRKSKGNWSIGEPSVNNDPLRLRPSLRRIRELLEQHQDARIPVDRILRELAAPPYGVRSGLAPLLVAVLVAAHEEELAVYESDVFLQRMTGLEFQRLLKAPATFSLQLCKLAGVRGAVFQALLQVLGESPLSERQPTLLDVVRPLCVFASKLPPYAVKTRQLSPVAQSVRTALLAAREPATLLFSSLPQACGFEPFAGEGQKSATRIRAFASTLRGAIDELRAVYPKLLESMRTQLIEALDLPGGASELRSTVSAIGDSLVFRVSDVRLKGFCLRLSDRNLGDSEWLEALGAFACSKPPSRWTDLDFEFFKSELARLASLVRRVEAASFGPNTSNGSIAVRIAVTFSDGTDVSQVVQLVADEEPRAAEIQVTIARILSADGRVALAAASRAIRQALDDRDPGEPTIAHTTSEIVPS